MLRIASVPFFACAFLFGLKSVGYAIFLFAISTDLADGYMAKRLGVTSDFGAYYDVTADTIFTTTMFAVFFIAGCYPFWIVPLIIIVYIQFMITSRTAKITYDPLGKYYGSLLYGAIGLTLLFSGRLFFDVVTVSIVGVTAASLVSRIAYFILCRNRQHL
jgi:CDP-diacylglycerol--glycerol-3-phosphate 3-phosphatidyltransferase/cardiolipin synthase